MRKAFPVRHLGVGGGEKEALSNAAVYYVRKAFLVRHLEGEKKRHCQIKHGSKPRAEGVSGETPGGRKRRH